MRWGPWVSAQSSLICWEAVVGFLCSVLATRRPKSVHHKFLNSLYTDPWNKKPQTVEAFLVRPAPCSDVRCRLLVRRPWRNDGPHSLYGGGARAGVGAGGSAGAGGGGGGGGNGSAGGGSLIVASRVGTQASILAVTVTAVVIATKRFTFG